MSPCDWSCHNVLLPATKVEHTYDDLRAWIAGRKERAVDDNEKDAIEFAVEISTLRLDPKLVQKGLLFLRWDQIPTAELPTTNKGHYGCLTAALLLLAHSEWDSDPLSREQSLRFLHVGRDGLVQKLLQSFSTLKMVVGFV